MKPIPQDQIVRQLGIQNPWWRPPHRAQAFFRQWQPRLYHHHFELLVRDRGIRRAILLLGPRRVGKTVLMHHTIQCLLEDGVTPARILYLSMDHPLFVDHGLEALLDLYDAATDGDIRQSEDETFLFFDEIQYLDQWQHHLKLLVDTYPQLKIVASGSAAAALRRQCRESGAGRFTDFLLPPLTFYEYLYISGMIAAETPVLVWMDARPSSHHSDVSSAPVKTTIPIDELNEHFVDYVNLGGYPETLSSPSLRRDPGRFIKSDIIDNVLLRDLPSLYGIQDTQELNTLFTTLAFHTANETSYEQLSTGSGVAKNTIKRYLEYLEAAFLIRKIHRVDASARRFQRATTFKVYLTNPTMRAALFGPLDSTASEFGALVETAIFSQWFHTNASLHYARWRGGRGEVDIVRLNNRMRPAEAVEVKWSDRIVDRPRELAALIEFCKKNHMPEAIVTTRTIHRDDEIDGMTIRFVPASLYCLELGFTSIESHMSQTPHE